MPVVGSQRSRLRIIPELRNYHVATADSVVEADTVYFEAKYDLVGDGSSVGFEQVSFGQLLRKVISGRYAQLEIWEPLWMRLLPKHVITGLLWKVAGPFRTRRLVSYAMENNDIASLIGGRRRVPKFLQSAFSFALGAYIRLVYTRMAFASEGSREIYRGLPWGRSVTSELIPNLPARQLLRREDPLPNSVVMVARLEARKGTAEIMKAWSIVEAAIPNAVLTIIGSGPESPVVSRWASESEGTRRFLGGLQHHEVMDQVSRSSVLVLPSVRDGRWREQIGLPIHEGLLNGLTIVTTDETGLASLLASLGHHVVPMTTMDRDLPAAIIAAISSPLRRFDVVRALPKIDGRISANRWMSNGEHA